MAKHSSKKRKAILLAAAPILCALRGGALRAEEGAPQVDLSALSHVGAPISVAIIGGGEIPPPPVNPPPVNGFIPRVLYTLTDEQVENDFTFQTYSSNAPGGSYLGGGTPHYFSAILDTGAQASIVRWQDADVFNLAASGRDGAYEQGIQGVGGPDNIEVTDVSDPLGIYMTGYGSANTGGGPVTLKPNSPVKGQYSAAIMTTRENSPPAEPSSVVPSLIGSPMASQFQIHIKNTQPRQRSIGGVDIRTPQVEMVAPNTAQPGGYSRLALGIESGNGVSSNPVYFPSFDDFEHFEDNPSTPSFWASFIANVNATNTDLIDSTPRSISNTGFMFDTGAEVSVISSETAANLGIYVDNPEITPDFTVEVEGVGGNLIAPGFYLDTFNIATTGGPITWHDVPILVLDITDPRDFVGFVPGIMGTNLFTDRDIYINGITSNPYLGIGPQHRQWNHSTGGSWSTGSNWTVGVPNGQNIPATFYSAISTPQTVNVDVNVTLGSISFDNSVANYTLAGTGRITMQVSTATATVLPANMFVGFGSHTISAPMTLASNTVVTVDQPNAKLTLSGDVTVNSGVGILKSGDGTLEMKNVRGNSLEINGGKLVALANGTNSGTSKVQSISFQNNTSWDLKDNDLVVTGMAYSAIETMVKQGFGNFDWLGTGITSSTAATFAQTDSSRMLGIVDNNEIGYTTFSGQTVNLTDVLVKFTYTGDATLDGVVDPDDFNQFVNGFSFGGAPTWLNGDFDYSGVVDPDDFNAFIAGFNSFNASGGTALSEEFKAQLADFATANGLPLVLPEPSLLVPLALAGLLTRRRTKV